MPLMYSSFLMQDRLLLAVFRWGDAVLLLEALAEIVGVGKAAELRNGLHLQARGGEQMTSGFHALLVDVAGDGLPCFPVEESRQIRGRNLQHASQRVQGEIAGEVGINVGQSTVDNRRITLMGFDAHKAAISTDHVADEVIGALQSGSGYDLAGVIAGQLVQVEGVYASLLGGFSQQRVADDAVILLVSQWIRDTRLIIQL